MDLERFDRNQHELADMLGVDRTTITQYQRDGMPYTAGGRGKASSYDTPVCVLWKYGRDWLKRRGMPNLPAPTIIVICYLRALENEPFEFWWPRALAFAERAGAPQAEAETHVNRAIGIIGRQQPAG